MIHLTMKHWPTGARAVTVMAMIALLLPASQPPSPTRAAPEYSCGNPSSNHCFGTNIWDGATSGVQTHLDMRQIDCTTCATYTFVNVAQWYYPAGFGYWVEAAYGTFNYPTPRYPGNWSPRVSYYWTDNRPTWGYAEHELAIVPAGDYGPNKYLDAEIERTGTTTVYEIVMRSPSIWFATQYSTDNAMGHGYHIEVGAEVAGTYGASIPDTYIYDNRWIDSSGNQRLQMSDGYLSTTAQHPGGNGPIVRNWAFKPSQYPGGNFHVQCGC